MPRGADVDDVVVVIVFVFAEAVVAELRRQ